MDTLRDGHYTDDEGILFRRESGQWFRCVPGIGRGWHRLTGHTDAQAIRDGYAFVPDAPLENIPGPYAA